VSQSARVFALITGGGTGGHVYPALALAEELVTRGHERSGIRFVGAACGLEANAVPEAGFAIDLLPGRGLRRAFTPAAVRSNVGAVCWSAVAVARANRVVRRARPRVVVGVGGYASLPTLVAARAHRMPLVVHEQNAAPGLANRIAVRLGARAAVAIPGTPLEGAVVTGNPVRPAIRAVRRRPDHGHPTVAVVGGSLGARRLNDAMLDLYDAWRDRAGVSIHHVTGPRDYEGCTARLASLRTPGDRLDYRLVRYEEDMEALYATASVLVSRAGAVTVAELAAAGVPAVIVPLPGAPSDHQRRNAEALAAVGAAVLVDDRELDATRLGRELDALLGDPNRLDRMGAAALTVGRPDAAARLADLVEEAAGGG